MAGTTPVALIKQTLTVDKVFHLPILTDELVFHQFGAVCGERFFGFTLENIASLNSPYPDGIQPRFSNLGPASSSPCSHH